MGRKRAVPKSKNADQSILNKLFEMEREVANHLRPDPDGIEPVTGDPADQSAALSEQGIKLNGLARDTQTLRLIRQAIEKEMAGNYGLCEVCDGEISPVRLQALPFAIHCLKCQEAIEKKEKGTGFAIPPVLDFMTAR